MNSKQLDYTWPIDMWHFNNEIEDCDGNPDDNPGEVYDLHFYTEDGCERCGKPEELQLIIYAREKMPDGHYQTNGNVFKAYTVIEKPWNGN